MAQTCIRAQLVRHPGAPWRALSSQPCSISCRHVGALTAVPGNHQAISQQHGHELLLGTSSIHRRKTLLSLGLISITTFVQGPAHAAAASPFSKAGTITFTEATPALKKELGTEAWPIWEHDVGMLVDYLHEADEDCLFLQGRVVITPKGGAPVTVKVRRLHLESALVHLLYAGTHALNACHDVAGW